MMKAVHSGLEGGLYQAFWRWHFYAGVIVMPVLMLMALTGGLYLFRAEIDDAVYRPLMTVADGPVTTSPQSWVDAAEQATGGQAAQVTVPAPGRSAQVVVALPDGARRTAFVDPRGGRYLGSVADGGVMGWVKKLHGLTLFGPVANLLAEVAAGWAIVLVATGVVLWWPRGALRGQAGGVVTVRATPAKRLFWRDLHAVTGLFVGAVIVFLAVTGMPWSAVWGAQARGLVNAAGLGRPPTPAATTVEHHATSEATPAVPWTLQETDIHAGHDTGPAVGGMADGVDTVAQAAEAAALPRPYTLNLPTAPNLAWSAAYMPAKVEDTRTLYFNNAGEALAEIGYGDFGAGAKAIEWGIAVHQGGQFGQVNRLIMLAGCIAVWLLGVSALTMWWKRRPAGGLTAPRRPADRRAYWPLLAVVTPLALFYPLVGASLVLALGLDLVLRRLAPATAKAAS
jgi:uncharacterized iron-regulated membrane protein